MSTAEEKTIREEIKENRIGMYQNLDEIIKLRQTIALILPQNEKDFKQRYLLEARMKTISDILSSELSIRKAINDSLKLEFEVDRKTVEDDNDDGNVEFFVKAAKELEKLKKVQPFK